MPFDYAFINTRSTMAKKSLIGEGSYGCVVQPALRTVEYPNMATDDVGKLFKTQTGSSFSREVKILTSVQQLDPENKFTVAFKAVSSINSNDIKKESLRKCLELDTNYETTINQIILENGGKSVKSLPHNIITCQKFLLLFKVFIEGLQKVHSLGIIHRDIKPDNVLITPQKISLIDFGVSEDATKVYSKDNMEFLSYTYAYYPPEFYIASILLKYRNTKERFQIKLDNVMLNLSPYLQTLFKQSEISNIKPQIQEFIDEIKLQQYGYYDIFNKEMAFKCDIFGVSFIIREIAKKLVYSNENEKNIIYTLYKMCSEINPQKRATTQRILDFLSNKTGIIQGGNIMKREKRNCNKTTPVHKHKGHCIIKLFKYNRCDS